MKQKMKRMLALLCMFTLLTGLLVPVMGRVEEPMEALASVPTEFHENACPYGSPRWEEMGMSVCWGCSADGCMECGEQGVRGKMFYGVGKFNHWHDDDAEDLLGAHEGNHHRGYGYNTKMVPGAIEGRYSIEYYSCYVCSGSGLGKAGIYAEELWIKTEYYFMGQLIRTEKNPDRKYTDKECEGTVPAHWCPQCSETIYLENNITYEQLDYILKANQVLITDESGPQYHLPASASLTLNVEPSAGGSVSFDGVEYKSSVKENRYGTSAVTCYAKPAEGWEFVGWYDMSVGRYRLYDETHATLKAAMPKKDSTWTALFRRVPQYSLKVTYGEGGWIDTASVNGMYAEGADIKISAMPKTGYGIRWEGYNFASGAIEELSGNDAYKATLSFRMPAGDVSLKANFLSPTPMPTPEPGNCNVAVTRELYFVDGVTGKESLEDSVTRWDVLDFNEKFSLLLPVYELYEGNDYVLDSVEVNSDSGLAVFEVDEPENMVAVGGWIEKDAEIVAVYKHTVLPEPHICVPGDWKHNEDVHWKECECGLVYEEGSHVWENGEPDETGQVTKTCTVCGRTETAHQHKYGGWCPNENGWEELYDHETYHWKVCVYPDCNKAAYRGKHMPGSYVDEGDGYLVSRCTVCRWILDVKPVTITLTVDPNGGAFPDGSTEPATLEIQYGQTVPYGVLGRQYFPEKEGVDFQGYYYVQEEGSGCVYAPDYGTMTCVARPEYFKDNGDGTYTSLLKEDMRVYAQWRASSYLVEYRANAADGCDVKGIMYPSFHGVGEEKALSSNGYYITSSITYDAGDVSASVGTMLSNTMVSAKFLGWAENSTGTVRYTDKEKVKNLLQHAGTVTLYAVWDYGSVILPNAVSTDGGHKLAGWRKADGTVVSVLDSRGNYKEVEYAVCGDETLEAVWVPNTYTVSFDSRGGSECSPLKVTYRQPYGYGNGGLPVPEKTGHVFRGWTHEASGKDIRDASIVTTAADHTLVAVWSPVQVEITLDYNFDQDEYPVNTQKGTEAVENETLRTVDAYTDKMQVSYGSGYGTLPTPSMMGYNFAGWFPKESDRNNGTGDMVTPGTTVENPEAHTLYARWAVIWVKIYLDYNRDYTVAPEE